MKEEFSRAEKLLTPAGLEKLAKSRVAVFGAGGVGGYAIEALARCGVGAIDIIDNDKLYPSNINRQILALHSSLGRFKAEVARERILDINPDCKVTIHKLFFLPENSGEIDFTLFDYVLDAIDTISGKIAIAECASGAGVPLISAMGTGNRLTCDFKVTTLENTSGCPLARVMRRELKKHNISNIKVVFSASSPDVVPTDGVISSVSFVPPVAGFMLAGEAIKDIIKEI